MYSFLLLFLSLLSLVTAQGPWFPGHYYGANTGNIGSGQVPHFPGYPAQRIGGTLKPHVCGFNPFTRKCMDPQNYCPGTCMNFRYTYNTLYDCRCLVIRRKRSALSKDHVSHSPPPFLLY